MSKSLTSFHDSISGETIVREMTDEELLAVKQYKKDSENQAEQFKMTEAAKQSAQAKLAALGLTEEEVASILG